MDLKTRVFEIEAADTQYQALKNLSKFLPKAEGGFFVIGIALISYQLSWVGELWRKEVSLLSQQLEEKIKSHCFFAGWKTILKNSLYNKRLQNMKIKRLQRFLQWESFFFENINVLEDLDLFNRWLSSLMNQSLDAKTIVFATKIWWRRLRIFGKVDMFPFAIKIPVDSRWSRLFKGLGIEDKKLMQQHIDRISVKLNIAPLHIDWIVWPIIGRESVNTLEDLFQLLESRLGISSYDNSPDF